MLYRCRTQYISGAYLNAYLMDEEIYISSLFNRNYFHATNSGFQSGGRGICSLDYGFHPSLDLYQSQRVVFCFLCRKAAIRIILDKGKSYNAPAISSVMLRSSSTVNNYYTWSFMNCCFIPRCSVQVEIIISVVALWLAEIHSIINRIGTSQCVGVFVLNHMDDKNEQYFTDV